VEVKKGLYVARAVIMCNGLPVCTYLRMGHRNVLPVVRFEMTRRKICPIFLKIVSRKWGSPIPYLEPREGKFIPLHVPKSGMSFFGKVQD
jgi:hypothetical protein